MDVLFRSVVGKLWLTIIALFAFILTIFSLLLVQSFDSYYFHKQAESLKSLAERLSEEFVTEADPHQVFHLAARMSGSYRIGLSVIDENYRVVSQTEPDPEAPQIPIDQLLRENSLHVDQALKGQHPAPVTVILPGQNKEMNDRVQIIAVAVPIPAHSGAVILYQAIEDVNGTVGEMRKLIYIVGVIGFTMTTVFAFFLSSRIAFPLRQMKATAHRIAEGDYHAEIPIRTNDEIGDLASTFNTMASRLNSTVNALSHEKEQLASVLRSMIDGVVMIYGDGKIVVTNPPAENFLKDWKFEHPQEPSPVLQLYQRLLENEQEIREDIPLQGRIWSIVMTPLYVQEQIRGAVAVLRDMTQERKLDKLRQDFVANVSHELRTPLSMLQGYSEAIVDDIAATPEEHKELAKIIYDESVRMTKLVNELLDLARMEGGHVELFREEVAVRPYMERIQRKFTNLAREQEIALQLRIETKREHFTFDPDRMEQVLTNLVDNALRHTPTGGIVIVAAAGEKALQLEVSDTGSGIPQEDLPFVFERFYKADKARTRGRAGTGLGLSIVRNIVAAHGGKITVQSKLGEGTTFTITLPDEETDMRSGANGSNNSI
ncbi:ATP-binding protein [Brevibacillus sp. B_LB10_24]|uniref:ATP-binding protein n=1 Tax=Brevibacillus sp. B_LB10_24 TaxID=3380645 RepID=UPI0038BA532C